jgi:two-component system phosphate regulon sensor histidine kinase PhoR
VRNIQQINALVNDILFLQEIELVLPDFQPVDMNEIARLVVERYTDKAKEQDVTLKLKQSRGLPRVSGDFKSLERALMALVDNAIKFSTHGGDVEIRSSSDGDKVFVAVEDHGIGIPTQNQKHIFDRFYHVEHTGDHLFGGIGLGLAITRQVIEQHQGSLGFTSEPGKGSTFTLTLKKW